MKTALFSNQGSGLVSWDSGNQFEKGKNQDNEHRMTNKLQSYNVKLVEKREQNQHGISPLLCCKLSRTPYSEYW